jgi:hypothetical protein
MCTKLCTFVRSLLAELQGGGQIMFGSMSATGSPKPQTRWQGCVKTQLDALVTSLCQYGPHAVQARLQPGLAFGTPFRRPGRGGGAGIGEPEDDSVQLHHFRQNLTPRGRVLTGAHLRAGRRKSDGDQACRRMARKASGGAGTGHGGLLGPAPTVPTPRGASFAWSALSIRTGSRFCPLVSK